MRTCSTSASRSFPEARIGQGAVWATAAFILLHFVSVATAQPASRSPLQASDLFRVRTIQEVVLSPSGRSAAYTVRRATSRGTDARTQLFVVPLSGRSPARQLTRSPQGASQPAWHPDGTLLAFVRPVEGVPQIFLLSLSGGEPYQLTDLPSGATHPSWGPQGERLLFASVLPRSAVKRRTGQRPPVARPGRTPMDTVRTAPPDTLVVLRQAQTLAPTDTLKLGPAGLTSTDTTTVIRPPDTSVVPKRLHTLRIDSLQALSPDSLRAVLDTLRLRPDTMTVPVVPDTAATPDGDLLQVRRWLARSRSAAPAVYASRTPVYRTTRGAPAYRHYFTIPFPSGVMEGTPPRPTPTLVTRGYRSYTGATWLPAGEQLVVSARPSVPSDSTVGRALYVVDMGARRPARLLQIDGYSLFAPHMTADGTTVAFRARPTKDPTYAQTEIGLFALNGRSDPQLITADFDHSVTSIRWAPDGWYLYATAPAGTGRPLYRFAPFARDTTTERNDASLPADRRASRDTFALDSSMVRTAPHKQMTDNSRRVRAFDVTAATAVYAAASPQTPSELFANTVSFDNERRLTVHNRWLLRRRLGETIRLTARHDSLSLTGRLTRPVSTTDSLRYPLLVVPRGGPTLLARPDPAMAWFERHYLAGRGFAVVEAWPRGSVGFGQAFRRTNYRDWGPGPMGDVLAVADSAATRSWVDTTRWATAGHGYGATLTAWMVGHTDRFRAAVAQNGVYDLASLAGRPGTGALLPDQFGGFPWEGSPRRPSPTTDSLGSAVPLPPDSLASLPDTAWTPASALRYNSPATHVARIRTPLLLMRGPSPPPGARGAAASLYRRLRVLERPVEYTRYPAPATPAQRRDRLVRLYEFVARFLPPGGRAP